MRNILNNSTKWKCCCLRIFSKKNELMYNRFAVIISKKLGNAVNRNKIKRFIREIVRKNKKRSPPYQDILIQPQSGIVSKKCNEIALCIEKWKKTQENI